jgi:hypothetical protein
VRPTSEQTPGCRGYTGGQPDSRAVQQGAQVVAASSVGRPELRRPCRRLRRSWACVANSSHGVREGLGQVPT